MEEANYLQALPVKLHPFLILRTNSHGTFTFHARL